MDCHGLPVDSSQYAIDPWKARLVWLQQPDCDSVVISFRTLGFYFGQTRRAKSDTLINRTPTILFNPFQVRGEEEDAWLDFGGLDYNGSFARGLSFGNRQDVVLNSSFNLQLSGNLGEEVEILAAMTDNNIPIQPEGNTQQLQDFDQVFIQLKRRTTTLTVGDFEWRTPQGYFLRYNKKLQGAGFQTSAQIDSNTSMQAKGSIALARGQFGRNVFFGQEGNQGPYRLQGNNNESFIIVLAGSERVYIDGVKMERGAEYDYIMDYNTGEVTFTPNRLITKDIRIIIEFEYSTQDYFRSLVNAQNTWQTGRWNFSVNLYSEQDAKNQPVLQELDSTRRAILASVGDSIQLAVVPGFDSVGFVSDQVRYARIDTVVNGQPYTILRYSTQPDSAVYEGRFSFVGDGNGSYRISSTSTVNGRIYEWVAPENGQLQGSYEPLLPVVAPQQRQLVSAGAGYQIGANTRIGAEVALSNRDVNTLSEFDNSDNTGVATFVSLDHTLVIRRDSGRSIQLAIDGDYEWAGQRFRQVETYRPMEFTRDWNTNRLAIRGAQHLAGVQLHLMGQQFGQSTYGLSTYQIMGQYSGVRHSWLANLRKGHWRFTSQSSLLTSSGSGQSTRYLRPTLELSRQFGNWRGAVGYMQEDNRVFATGSDSLWNTSFGFREWRYSVSKADTSRIPVQFRYVSRIDRLPVLGALPINNRGQTASVTGGWQPGAQQQLVWTATYRNLRYLDTTGVSEQTALGRIQYNATYIKGLVRWNTLYEVGTGQEPKREFTFVTVPEGQGTHIWIDDGDGIPELEEFEIASETDAVFANYIRVFTPTREFVKTNQVQLNQVIDIRPAALFSGGQDKPFLSKWSNITTLNLNRKVVADGNTLQVNPFVLDVADTALIAINSLIRNSLFYNRFGSDLSAELTFQDNRSKQLLTNGPESRQLQYTELQLRWVFNSNLSMRIRGRQGFQRNASDALITRNFSFSITEAEPELNWQYEAKFRIAGRYLYAQKTNAAELGGEEAIIHQLTLDSRYTVVVKSNINLRLSYADVNYSGNDSNSLAYAMLAGLRNGNNLIWTLAWERRLGSNMQLSITYDGRKAGDNPMVHIGQAQLRAIF